MAYVCHGPWTYTYFMIFIFNNFSKLILMFICADELIESHATATEVNLRCWTHKYLSNIWVCVCVCVRVCIVGVIWNLLVISHLRFVYCAWHLVFLTLLCVLLGNFDRRPVMVKLVFPSPSYSCVHESVLN